MTLKILRSVCRQKMLKALAAKRKASIMELVRVCNSTYNEVNRNLRILEEEGFITQQHVRRKRIIRLNLENKKTSALLKTLRTIDTVSE